MNNNKEEESSIACKLFKEKDLCWEFNLIKEDKEYKRQVNEQLNMNYMRYAKFPGSKSLSSYLAMATTDQGCVATEYGRLLKFKYNPKT